MKMIKASTLASCASVGILRRGVRYGCCLAILVGLCLGFATRATSATEPGYLFVDGEYVAPPYRFETNESSVTVNGREIALSYFGNDEDTREAKSHDSRSHDSRMSGDSSWRPSRPPRGNRRGYRDGDQRGSIEREIASTIGLARGGCVIILYPGMRPVCLSGNRQKINLLQHLTSSDSSHITTVSNAGYMNPEVIERLIDGFQPTQAFLSRAYSDLKVDQELGIAGEAVSNSVQILDRISYPLTIFAMAAIVFGFGHLLSNRPPQTGQEFDFAINEKVITKTLVIIGVLSVIDLIWTIAASNAGTMRELNPIGSEMIESPIALIAFKLTVTGGAIAILFRLQQQKVAHTAAWWCCLVLTLLTARCVIFQSMFV